MIAAVEYVDYVIISEEFGKMDHAALVKLLKPHLYVVPSTDSAISQKRAMIEKAGGCLVTCKRLPPGHLKGGISTTGLEKLLLSLK